MKDHIPDQTALWNAKHSKGEHAAHRTEPAPFALFTEPFFPPGARILEIGCGVGSDADFFANKGYDVLATDVSSVVLGQNKEYYTDSKAIFEQLDVSLPLPFDDGAFQVAYSHLALHYYSDADTRAIFSELTRILEPGGVLAFACKSTHDSKYGSGDVVEEDMFVAKGHLRHFFTVDYARSLLGNEYDILHLDEITERYSKDVSALVRCVARKK